MILLCLVLHYFRDQVASIILQRTLDSRTIKLADCKRKKKQKGFIIIKISKK